MPSLCEFSQTGEFDETSEGYGSDDSQQKDVTGLCCLDHLEEPESKC